MAYRALIVYSSITGNTEQLAFAFRDALEKYKFKVDTARLGKHDFNEHPTYFEDYDLVILGTPIMAALPHQALMNALGMYEKPGQPRFRRPPEGFDEEKTMMENEEALGRDPIQMFAEASKRSRLGIVFVTYGGYLYGPSEATASIEILRTYLETKGCSVVGEFSCPGREVFHNAVDTVAKIMNIGVNESSQALQDFKDNPNAEQFSKLSDTQREMMDRCANDKKHWPFDTMYEVPELDGIPGCIFWHYDLMNRPNERDLSKARIFAQEIAEDYFMTATGKPRNPVSVYKCLA
ncbi:MAG: flavodoxin domain-containing protein [Clostridiales Family XIII bacterium]|nr:flavodoxin domain-containing protein [Clostridiales Family XIII bacterium]